MVVIDKVCRAEHIMVVAVHPYSDRFGWQRTPSGRRRGRSLGR